MKKLFSLFVLINTFTVVQAQDELNIITLNIRYNNPSDSLNAWPFRKDKVSSELLFYKAEIIGIQEALSGQITDIQNALTGYGYVGVGRDDGKLEGEFSAIFYNKSRLALTSSNTFWLSETPLIAGKKGWDAVCARIITWAQLKDKANGKTFFVFNTHFDHIGQVSRRESARLLLHAVDSIAGKQQAIVTGDFNAHPEDEPIQIITGTQNKLHLTDTKAISQTPHYGPTGTFNGFKSMEENDQPIDYIFCNREVTVLEHATISETWKGRFASDHFAVYVRVRL